MYAARTVISLNVTSLLMAYQGELLEDMGNFLDSGMPNPAVWEEICEYQTLRLQGHYPRLWVHHESCSGKREGPVAEPVQRQRVEFFITEPNSFHFCLPLQ